MATVKTIVCFGDSNTWGYDPATRDRFPPETRWTGILQQTLGSGYRVIEEGLNGRTTNVDDPIEANRNGLTYLRPCLESHRPIDLVTIMLGTNDLKARFNRSASDIAESAASLVGVVQTTKVGPNGTFPRALLIAPPPVATLSAYDEMFLGATEKSQRFAKHFPTVAAWYNAPLLLAADIIHSSDLDGIHFEADQHLKLGQAVAREIERILS